MPQRLSRGSLAVVVIAHVFVLFGLLQMNVITLPAPPAILSVSLLPSIELQKLESASVPPKPRPMSRQSQSAQRLTQLAVPLEAASTPALVSPEPPYEAPASSIVTALQAEPPQIEPRFDAEYLDNPSPPYPAISRRFGEQGRVLLRVNVDAEGRAGEVQLHTSSGSPRLDQSALDTVRRWKFVPARRGQEPVAAWVLIPIAFTLKD